jgi:hypothetical protein
MHTTSETRLLLESELLRDEIAVAIDAAVKPASN